jgi:putative transcriptional regulator
MAEVWFNFLTKKVYVKNYTNNVLHRPFGVNEHPTFNDLEEFMESRCFPRSRGNCKELLGAIGLDYYDPFEIVKINGGNCQEDNLYIEYTEGLVPYAES